jgi:hypothetical protein
LISSGFASLRSFSTTSYTRLLCNSRSSNYTPLQRALRRLRYLRESLLLFAALNLVRGHVVKLNAELEAQLVELIVR